VQLVGRRERGLGERKQTRSAGGAVGRAIICKQAGPEPIAFALARTREARNLGG
jgi:hypothetical protein